MTMRNKTDRTVYNGPTMGVGRCECKVGLHLHDAGCEGVIDLMTDLKRRLTARQREINIGRKGGR